MMFERLVFEILSNHELRLPINIQRVHKWWHKDRGIGFGGDMFWTWNNKNKIDNYVIWRPNLRHNGYYKVYVFIPRNYAYTKNAYYEIYHAHGKTVKKVDQSRYYDKWVYLGKYYFKAGRGYVKFTDKTGERWATKKIGFDAIKFELVKKTKSKPKQGNLLHFDLNFRNSLSDAKHRKGDGKDEKAITVKPGQELKLYIFYKEGNTKNPYIVRVYPSWNKGKFIANSDNNEQTSEVGWEIGGGRWDVQKFKAPTKAGKYEIKVVYKKGKKAPTYYNYNRLLAKGYVIVRKSESKDKIVEKTIKWAKSQKGKWRKSYRCLEFVQLAYKNAGKNLGGPYGSAKNLANKLERKGKLKKQGIPPRGALVFYDWTKCGHVGISLGKGKVIHAYTSKGKVEIKISQYKNIPGCRYIGWTEYTNLPI